VAYTVWRSIQETREGRFFDEVEEDPNSQQWK